MDLDFDESVLKKTVFEKTADYLNAQNLPFVQKDDTRPWGGFFVIDEQHSKEFIENYFPQHSREALSITGKLSPKILVVAPGKRLSWQYHHRRAEIWKLIGGEAGIITSDTNEEKEIVRLQVEDIIELKQGERHRLIGLKHWGIIAEIWRHTDADHPSDENDIVRVQDDYGR